MIEIIQETEKTRDKQEVKLPRNIRQIGNPEKDFRIYMEDYVYTYLHPVQIYGFEIGIFPRLLVLVGEIEHFSNRSCAFISGAVQVENDRFPEELPELNDASWKRVKKQMQQYFDKCQVVGWVLDIPGNNLQITPEIEEMHRRNFADHYQFFFLMDSKEREEAFFTWKQGRLTKKEGYFIYYEKNPQMQEYMISRRQERYGEQPSVEEVDDEAARSYRSIMMERKERSYKRHTRMFSYAISSLMVIVLCSISVLLIGYIKRMDHMEETLTVMSVAMEATEQGQVSQPGQVAVETVNSSVVPLEEAKNPGDSGESLLSQEETRTTEEDGDREKEDAGTWDTTAGQGESGAENKTAGQEKSGTQDGNTGQGESGAENGNGSQEGDGVQEENAGQGTDGTQEAGTGQDGSTSEGALPPSEAETYLAQGYYIVKPGDSLKKICFSIYQSYDKIEEICKINGIKNQDTILTGQKLILP